MSVDNRRNMDFAFPTFAPGLPSVYERAGFDVRRPSRSGNASIKSAKSSKATGSSPALYTPQTGFGFDAQPPMPFAHRNNSSPRLVGTPPPGMSPRVRGASPAPGPSVASPFGSPARVQPGAATKAAPAGIPSEVPAAPVRSVPVPSVPHLAIKTGSISSPNIGSAQIPSRAAARGPVLPLSTKKTSVDSKASSSLHSAGSSYSQTYSGSDTTNSTADTSDTVMSPQMDFFFKDIDNIAKNPTTRYNMNTQAEHVSRDAAPEPGSEHEFLAAPDFNGNRFSTTSSIYSYADHRKSEIMIPHGGFNGTKALNVPNCPYPEATPEPEEREARVAREVPMARPTGVAIGPVPTMPPMAPEHAKRVSSLKNTSSQASSLRSSQAATKNCCRECSLEINGKSVYSKDGKMTGHWHRPCFVCTDCRTSLSSEVYVLSDSPYCSDCYHQSNKSVCKTCGEGIEGLCLEGVGEDEDDVLRYHPSCLECVQCSLPLADVYYELGGLTYCEDHKASAGQARRRTTRILMNN